MRKTKQLIWIGCIALGIFLAASTFLMSHAQKKSETQKVENQDEQIRQARAAVSRSIVGTMLLDTISVKESEWLLNKAGYFDRHEHNKAATIDMLLKKGDKFLGLTVSECDSANDADERFYGVRSYGASVPFNNYGDKGDKLIGQNGDLLAIRFRKGNYFVTIWNRDQKTAERFAAYVLTSLGDAGVK